MRHCVIAFYFVLYIIAKLRLYHDSCWILARFTAHALCDE